ncbi:MAG: Calx-beta domain-containing protein [Bacteroidota bacterium]
MGVVTMIVAACDDFDLEDQEIILEDLPAYVAFNASGQSVDADVEEEETGGTVTLNIEAPTGSLSDITANYTFGGDAVFGEDFTVAGATATGGSVVIENDPTIGDFDNVDLEVTLLTDAVADGTKTLEVILTDAVADDGTIYAVGRGGTEILRSATITIEDVPLVVELDASSLSVTENNTMDTTFVSVSLNFAVSEDVSVDVATGGTLMEGADFTYTGFGPQLVVPQGETSASFGIISVDDNMPETGDSLLVVVSNAAIGGTGFSVTLGDADSLTFDINDEVKALSFDVETDSLILDQVSDAGFINFPITLSDVSPVDVTINYTITGVASDTTTIQAVSGVHFNDATGGSITFSAGQTEKEVAIQILEAGFMATGSKPFEFEVEIMAGGLTTSDAEVEVSSSNTSFSVVIVPE